MSLMKLSDWISVIGIVISSILSILAIAIGVIVSQRTGRQQSRTSRQQSRASRSFWQELFSLLTEIKELLIEALERGFGLGPGPGPGPGGGSEDGTPPRRPGPPPKELSRPHDDPGFRPADPPDETATPHGPPEPDEPNGPKDGRGGGGTGINIGPTRLSPSREDVVMHARLLNLYPVEESEPVKNNNSESIKTTESESVRQNHSESVKKSSSQSVKRTESEFVTEEAAALRRNVEDMVRQLQEERERPKEHG